MSIRSERGLTLTEITVVTVLASLVMLGVVSFYVNSQGTWMDASAQAITQREATALFENIGMRVHAAGKAEVMAGGTQLEVYDPGATNPTYVYWWNVGDGLAAGDSLIHEGPSRIDDHGASGTSIVENFSCSRNDSLVGLSITLRSAQGQRVEVTTSVAMINRAP